MQKIKNTFYYLCVIGGFSTLIYWIIQQGKGLELGRNIHIPEGGASQWYEFICSFLNNLHHPLAILLAQIVTIIIVSRILGLILKKIHQPAVIGEIIAGIALGPSLLGMAFPELSMALFPENSLNNLNILSQIGLILSCLW